MRRRSFWRSVPAVAGAVAGIQIVCATGAMALPGQLDASFNGGKVTHNLGSTAVGTGVIRQSNGKIVVTGTILATNTSLSKIALLRYNANGTVDNFFGTTAPGYTITALPAAATAHGSASDSMGRILVVGQVKEDVLVARYTPNGVLDTSFGFGAGYVLTDFNGTVDTGNAIAVDPNGRIVVAGSTGHELAVAVYLTDGSPDLLFGVGGKVTTDLLAGAPDSGRSVAVQPNGYVVVAGASGPSLGMNAAVARYRIDGTPDLLFGGTGTGFVITNFGGPEDHYNAVLVQTDGKILAGGTTNPWAGDFALGRYTALGVLDTGFGSSGSGMVTTDMGGPGDGVRSLIQRGDHLLAVGTTDPFLTGDFAVARYMINGTPDLLFNGGEVTTDIGSSTRDVATAAVLDSRCTLVAAGWSSNRMAAARYQLC